MALKKSQIDGYYDLLESPVGKLFLVFSRAAHSRMVLSSIMFERPAAIPPLRHSSESSAQVKKELSEYFGREREEFTCETVFTEGTEFERKVWRMLREIPYGETRSYKWLAMSLGQPNAARAVGNALGKNPLPIIFPCHRIIESNGSLGGYTGGPDIKLRLLEIEYYTTIAAK